MSQYKKTALVLGAGGFIGSHMVKRLKSEGYWVRGVDLHYPEFSGTHAHEFIIGDLRDVDFVRKVLEFKGEQGNHYNSVPIDVSYLSMRYISLLLTWVVQDLYLLVRMMQRLCTTLAPLILMFLKSNVS